MPTVKRYAKKLDLKAEETQRALMRAIDDFTESSKKTAKKAATLDDLLAKQARETKQRLNRRRPDPRYECPVCGRPYGSYEYPYGQSVGAQGICEIHGAFWVPDEPYEPSGDEYATTLGREDVY